MTNVDKIMANAACFSEEPEVEDVCAVVCK
jgi:hypothetical protein